MNQTNTPNSPVEKTVLLTGTLMKGFFAYGPFDTSSDATDFGNKVHPEMPWETLVLTPVQCTEDGQWIDPTDTPYNPTSPEDDRSGQDVPAPEVVESIDITPPALKDPVFAKRASLAMEKMKYMDYQCFMSLSSMIQECGHALDETAERELDCNDDDELFNLMEEAKRLVDLRRVWCEEMMRAVAGQPPATGKLAPPEDA